ncbi:unnamed protein product, partial [Owenia fusiformis]
MTISGNIGKSPLSSPSHKGIKKLQVGGAKIESGSGKLPVGVKSVNQDVAPSPKVVQKEELEGFAVQVAALDRAKQMSDRRAEKLANVVRRLKERKFNMHSANTKLTEQCTKVKGDMSDVQEELIKSKEDTLLAEKYEHQLELKEIWRL